MRLDCGHTPSEHGPHATGTAHTPDGREVCWACADDWQRAEMQTSDRLFAYFHAPSYGVLERNTQSGINTPQTITTWSGGFLARVTYAAKTRPAFGGRIYNLRAVDATGTRWYGTSPGPGMYCRLRRAK